MLLICPECRSKVSEHAKFCPSCGLPAEIIHQRLTQNYNQPVFGKNDSLLSDKRFRILGIIVIVSYILMFLAQILAFGLSYNFVELLGEVTGWTLMSFLFAFILSTPCGGITALIAQNGRKLISASYTFLVCIILVNCICAFGALVISMHY